MSNIENKQENVMSEAKKRSRKASTKVVAKVPTEAEPTKSKEREMLSLTRPDFLLSEVLRIKTEINKLYEELDSTIKDLFSLDATKTEFKSVIPFEYKSEHPFTTVKVLDNSKRPLNEITVVSKVPQYGVEVYPRKTNA